MDPDPIIPTRKKSGVDDEEGVSLAVVSEESSLFRAVAQRIGARDDCICPFQPFGHFLIAAINGLESRLS